MRNTSVYPTESLESVQDGSVASASTQVTFQIAEDVSYVWLGVVSEECVH